MKRVVEFDTEKDKYQYVTLVARDLGIYRKVLDVMLVHPFARKCGSDNDVNYFDYTSLPYIGKGIAINKDLAHTARDWRVSRDDAEEIKRRFRRLDNSTRRNIISLSDRLWREQDENFIVSPQIYKRMCLSSYVGMSLRFHGTITNLRVAQINEHRDSYKVIRVYISDISSPDDTRINLDHVVFNLQRDGYLVLKKYINIDDIFDGGVEVQFKAEVCKYAAENRYGLKHLHAVQALQGGGNKV